jgi:hypothetical protein
MALFWALGRADQPEDLEAIKAASAILSSHESFGPRPSSAPGPVFSVTVRSGIFLARALTDSLDEAEAFRAQVWGVIRPLLLGRKPVAPYIWST